MLDYISIAFAWFSINTLLNYNYKNKHIIGDWLSFIHSSSSILFTYPYVSQITIPEYKNEVLIYKEDYKYIFCSTICFYILDLITLCIPSRLYKYIIHHISGLIVIIYMLYDKYSLNIGINILFYAECSVPIYILYNKLKKGSLKKVVLVIYNCIGTWSRVLKFGHIFIMFALFSPINNWIILIPGGIICLGSFAFQCSMWRLCFCNE